MEVKNLLACETSSISIQFLHMRQLVFGILLLFFSSFAFSQPAESQEAHQEEQIDQNLVVSRINFIGLKKTRPSYIGSKVAKFTGNSIAETDMHGLETAIQLEGLFDDIQISTEQISETEAQITVSVKEKITFIPLPFAMYSSAGFMAGGIVMDTNAFGRKDMFMIGGFFSSTAKTGMASFVKQSQTKGVPGVSLFLSVSKTSPKYYNLDDDEVLKYKAFSFEVGLKLSEKIGENFIFSNGFGFTYHNSKDERVESITEGSTSIGFAYAKSDWNGVFMSTNSASVNAEVGLTNSEDKAYRFPLEFSALITEQHPIFIDRLRLYQRYSGVYGYKNHISGFKGREAGSVTILPGNFSTERIVGGNLGLEVAIAKFRWGMISLYSDYQVVYAQDFELTGDGDYEFCHGPNGGAKFYLAKIAVPALAMGVSYNVTKNYWQFAAAVGVSF